VASPFYHFEFHETNLVSAFGGWRSSTRVSWPSILKAGLADSLFAECVEKNGSPEVHSDTLD